MRELVDRQLRQPVRRALLGDGVRLPTPRWERLSKRHVRPLGVLPELAYDAGVVSIPVALRRIADAIDADVRQAA